ncbi:hypothetical protein ACWGHA_10075 [Streptomyces xanthophaeus]
MPEEDAPLLVVGAGIGGPATAVALGRRRIPYVLVEALPQPGAIDAGVLLQHNTVRVLDALGASQRSTPPTWKGRPALRPRASTAGTCPRPCRHGSSPPPSSRATPPAFRTHPGGAELRLRSGRRLSGRGIVAADGIDPPVRSRLYGAQPAVRSGTTCLRGLTTAAAGEQDDGQDGRPDDGQHSGAVSAWWGDRLQFGIIPLPAGRTSWFALAPTAVLTARQQDGPGGLAPHRSLFAGFPSPVEDLLARTTPESTVETELRRRPWRGGRGRRRPGPPPRRHLRDRVRVPRVRGRTPRARAPDARTRPCA